MSAIFFRQILYGNIISKHTVVFYIFHCVWLNFLLSFASLCFLFKSNKNNYNKNSFT